jgi:rhodanese-related sulfurtransferase
MSGMAHRADTAEVQRLVEGGAQLLEVLPTSAFASEHLPGARNIPLPDLNEDAISRSGLVRDRPTVVYCYDHECDLSARGAELLEALGFSEVHDYAGSKTAWTGEGLAVEGTVAPSCRAGAVARPVPTCRIDAHVGELCDRSGDDGVVVVVNDEEVVLGLVREEATRLDPQSPVADVMLPGPPSVRPSITASELARSMDEDGRRYVLVTTSHGPLLGIITAPDLDGQH